MLYWLSSEQLMLNTIITERIVIKVSFNNNLANKLNQIIYLSLSMISNHIKEFQDNITHQLKVEKLGSSLMIILRESMELSIWITFHHMTQMLLMHQRICQELEMITKPFTMLNSAQLDIIQDSSIKITREIMLNNKVLLHTASVLILLFNSIMRTTLKISQRASIHGHLLREKLRSQNHHQLRSIQRTGFNLIQKSFLTRMILMTSLLMLLQRTTIFITLRLGMKQSTRKL